MKADAACAEGQFLRQELERLELLIQSVQLTAEHLLIEALLSLQGADLHDPAIHDGGALAAALDEIVRALLVFRDLLLHRGIEFLGHLIPLLGIIYNVDGVCHEAGFRLIEAAQSLHEVLEDIHLLHTVPGDEIEVSVDTHFERISNVYYNNSASPAASYIYSGNGGLGRVTDNAAGKVTDYSYDSLNRLTSMTERYGTYGVQVYLANYDSSNRVSQTGYKVSPAWNGVFRDNRIYCYTYSSSDGSLSTMALPANGQYAYTYTYYVSSGGVLVHNRCGDTGTYNSLHRAEKGTGNEVHHIIEKRFLKLTNYSSKGRMQSVVLSPQEHALYTKLWRKTLPYGGNYSTDQVINAARKVYAGNKKLLDIALSAF